MSHSHVPPTRVDALVREYHLPVAFDEASLPVPSVVPILGVGEPHHSTTPVCMGQREGEFRVHGGTEREGSKYMEGQGGRVQSTWRDREGGFRVHGGTEGESSEYMDNGKGRWKALVQRTYGSHLMAASLIR